MPLLLSGIKMDDREDIEADKKAETLREEMIFSLTNDKKVSQEDLNMLARNRAQPIISPLAAQGIETDRLELLESLGSVSDEKESEYISTKLELGAK